MASGSLKKKPKQRSINRSPSSMASPSSPFRFRRKSLIISSSLIISVLVLLYITSKKKNFEAPLAELHSVEVVNEFPHDPEAFTQGLLYGGDDTLFESTGLKKHSSVRKVALQTGKVEILQKMDDFFFGEGLTLLGDRLFQVTWLDKTGFMYDRHNLSKFEKFTHQMPDGWGLATDGKVLFGSDGSSTLYHLDPQTFQVIRRDTVKYKGHEVHNLNELEYVNGEVWANVWQSDCIARISQKDGIVLGWILLPDLRFGSSPCSCKFLLPLEQIDVLNGIAWDSQKNRLFVTGKLWPKLYEIKLHPIREQQQPGVIEELCLRRYEFHFM
ncbi:Glutamine cyclotransferase [Macleaya cordata]|uniref:Glutamine cyclotransferase n=1 Tax=Macleaya cordata TaxID=56857 RepID=A0A200QU22_MACCD|nr:Glutamine cyclotransferase [Macleaya cordata]